MDFKNLYVASFLLVSLIALPAYTVSSTQVISKEVAVNQLTTNNYWTEDRLMNAKPMPLPEANPHKVHEVSLSALKQSLTSGEVEGSDGKPPTVTIKSGFQQLFVPKQNTVFPSAIQKSAVKMLDRGGSNDNFSSSQLVPITADLAYPYRAIGKLYFTIPGSGDYVCSASVLRPRVILTAGHCVHSGSGGKNGFYTNWRFIPAYRDGAAPLQIWDATFVATTTTWASGNGDVPNAADYAMIEVADKNFNGKTQRIGDITGYLGYQTLSLIPNHSHMLGYPCNLDKCQKMHQVTAQSSRAVDPNNAEYGSDMRGGSSGGPWVQNFGVFAQGQTGGSNSGLNRVVGVTSYGYTDDNPKVQGAAIFDQRFTGLLNTLCNHKNGNC